MTLLDGDDKTFSVLLDRAPAVTRPGGYLGTTAAFKPVDDDPDSPVMVPVALLEIDTSYQYDPNTEPGRLAELKAWHREGGFKPAIAGAIHVSLRASGRLMVVDGWGRTTIAKWDGKEYILAIVHKGLTIREEGILFRKLNNDRRIIRAPHLFIVDGNSGIEPQASIMKLVKAAAYRLEKLKGDKSKGAVLGPQSLVFGYTLGPLVLEKALFDLRHTWGDTADGRAVASLCPLIAANPGVYSQDRMRAVLSDPEFTCDYVMKDARTRAAAAVLSTRNPQPRDTNPVATLILGARYNYRLSTTDGSRLDLSAIDSLKSRFEGHREFHSAVYKWTGEK